MQKEGVDMKKCWYLFALLLMLIVVLAACGNENNAQVPTTQMHTHNFGNWNTVKDTTCTETGLQERICDCGEKETRSVAMLAHTEVVDAAVAHTCTTSGLTEGKHCSVCKEVLTEQTTVDAAHTWSVPHMNLDAHWFTCQVCGQVGEKVAHTAGADGYCDVCDLPMTATEGFVYKLSADGTYAVVDYYDGTATKVRIAEEYQGRPVTEICSEAFYGAQVVSVVIPASVTYIPDRALFNCTELTGIWVDEDNPNYVSDDSGVLFNKDMTLLVRAHKEIAGDYTIPQTVTAIGGWAFYGCTNLTGVTIGDAVTTIGTDAFRGCSGLTDVTIGDHVTTIGSGAFAGCSSLTSVTIPNSVTVICKEAFKGCSSLTNVSISDNIEVFGYMVFTGCTGLQFAEYGNCKYLGNPDNPYLVLLWNVNMKLDTYVIHNDTRVIAAHAFVNCGSMTAITIPDGVVGIGDSAFAYCSGLTGITIPDSVTNIGHLAFAGCSELTSVTIPDSVTSIGGYAFHLCISLTDVTLGNNVTSISNDLFHGCSNLVCITIPDSVTYIDEYAFYNCRNLEEIHYNGTKEQWYAIEKEYSWHNGAYNFTVYCIDGTIEA